MLHSADSFTIGNMSTDSPRMTIRLTRPVAQHAGSSASDRQLWFGDVPITHDERACLADFAKAGLPVPQRVLVRASTGNAHGFYGIAYFRTAGEASMVMSTGNMQWSDGSCGPIRLLNQCASNIFFCFRQKFRAGNIMRGLFCLWPDPLPHGAVIVGR